MTFWHVIALWILVSFAIGLIYAALNWRRASRNAGQWTVKMWAEHHEIPLDVARLTIPPGYLKK